MKSANNLKQIGLGIHNYHDANGKLPGPVRDKSGKPLLSWRVALLPELEVEALYRKFHLDEPWDSPHNLALMEPMPRIFGSAGNAPPQPTWTFYRLVTGPDTAFERDGVKFDDFPHGLSKTLFVIEAGEAVPWTKPEEWEYDPGKPLPPLGGIFTQNDWLSRQRGKQDGTNVLFGDGSVRFLPRYTNEAKWRALLTRNGKKDIELP